MKKKEDYQVSEHFKYSEFVKTNHREYADKNWLEGEKFEDNIAYMARWLEAIRKVWGKPIVINSGYRCYELNKAVGGAPSSNHRKACAVDIRCKSHDDAMQMAQTILYVSAMAMCNHQLHNGDFDELLVEHVNNVWWVHFAARDAWDANRRKIQLMKG